MRLDGVEAYVRNCKHIQRPLLVAINPTNHDRLGRPARIAYWPVNRTDLCPVGTVFIVTAAPPGDEMLMPAPFEFRGE